MFRIFRFIAGVRALFRKRQVEQEMDEELRGYLDDAAKAKMRLGMDQEEALRAARVEMGSIDGVKEEIRSAGWESTLETLWHDLRFGIRMLRRSPGFAVTSRYRLGSRQSNQYPRPILKNHLRAVEPVLTRYLRESGEIIE